MKVVTVFGTRPEIIRLSRVIPLLDQFAEHQLVHTGQNYDPQLSDVFFKDLGVRAPDVHLDVGHAPGFAAQAAAILEKTGELLAREKPDRLLILGDTNSGLSAIVAARLGIPVFHMEAGNRCYDDRVPEEINRRIIDHTSTVLMPYTQRSKDNLVREGIERERIFVTGNPIFEVLRGYEQAIEASDVMTRLGVAPRGYLLATVHRAENVDQGPRLEQLLTGLSAAGRDCDVDVLVSLHPRTADRMRQCGLSGGSLRLLNPLGFFDFVKLEKNARAVLSDSGTVQEECAIYGVPNVTIRDVTERAETIECGSNVLSGAAADDVRRALAVALGTESDWTAPPEYTVPRVSRTVAKIVLGHTSVKTHR
ncbi:MAG TPA: UDP-N-acetylglucosamine 2-epimerase (non-hydrolyzing) [Vicinamibacterales bacterium]|nr:UDP-N-acetylglucosamine 2-epimerase (non-hydrolyzing) [Vicinamibacterales bacterium]